MTIHNFFRRASVAMFKRAVRKAQALSLVGVLGVIPNPALQLPLGDQSQLPFDNQLMPHLYLLPIVPKWNWVRIVSPQESLVCNREATEGLYVNYVTGMQSSYSIENDQITYYSHTPAKDRVASLRDDKKMGIKVIMPTDTNASFLGAVVQGEIKQCQDAVHYAVQLELRPGMSDASDFIAVYNFKPPRPCLYEQLCYKI